MPTLDVDLRLDQLVLARHGGELAGRHGEGARDQPCDTGENDVRATQAAAADARDQADIGDESVHRAEHCGAQPAAADITMLVPRHSA